MYRLNHSIKIALALILLMAFFPSTMSVQSMSASPKILLGDEDTSLGDAEAYAKHYGVSLEEALYRFHIQDVGGKLDAKLSENETETFAGIWVEHAPEFKIVVLFTQDGNKTIESYLTKELANIVDVKPAKTSLVELQNSQQETLSFLWNMGISVESEINIYANNIAIFVAEADRIRIDNALQNKLLPIPDYIQIVTIPKLGESEAGNIYGGLALNKCNTAFSVQDIYGILGRGITTAGHCGDQNYILKYQSEHYLVFPD